RQLRDAFDEIRNLLAKLRTHLLERCVGVLDDVVDERSGERRVVAAELRGDLRAAQRMEDKVLPPPPLLPFMAFGSKHEGALEELPIDVRVVLGHFRQK